MWVDNKPKLTTTKLCDYGGSPVVVHSVKCWLCDKRSAVYSAYPEFIFKPCWYCQSKYLGQWTKKPRWYEFWKVSAKLTKSNN